MKHNVTVTLAELQNKFSAQAKIQIPRSFVLQCESLLGFSIDYEEIQDDVNAPKINTAKVSTGRKRGRPSKAEIAAREAQEEQEQEQEQEEIEEENSLEEEEENSSILSFLDDDDDDDEIEEIEEIEEKSKNRLDLIKQSCKLDQEIKTSYSNLTGPV